MIMLKTADINDLDVAASLAAKLWQKHGAEELKEGVRALILSDRAIIALCFENGAALGFAQCQLRSDYVEGTSTSPVGYLEGIFVEEAHRGRGIASALLQYCEGWARNIGCTEFASDCELDNLDSLHFHKSVGFSEANRIICFSKKL